MAKWIKIIIGLVVAVPVTAAVALATLVEPNDYKPEIEKLVSENTGREFSIQGDIGLSVFPWLGFEVEGLNLANHADFSNQAMFKVDSARARLKLLPLITGKLQIAVIEINGLAATVGLLPNGQPSWSDMVASSAEAEQTTAEEESEAGSLPDFSLAKLSVNDATLNWLDKAAGSTTSISPFNLEIGQASPGKPFPLTADLRLRQTAEGVDTAVDLDLVTKVLLDAKQGALSLNGTTLTIDADIPGLKPLKGEVEANIKALLDGSKVELSSLQGDLNKMTLAGALSASNLTAKPFIDTSLKLGVVNVDDFIESAAAESTEQPRQQTSAERAAAREALNATVVDASALNALDAVLSLNAEALKASGMTATNAVINANIKNGVLTLSELSAALYEGQLNATAKIKEAGKQTSYQWQHQLSNVKAAPLQEDMMEKAYISGAAAMNTTLGLQGNTVGALRNSLNGKGDLAFTDGALKGINVAGSLRKAFAKFKNQPVPENDTEVLDTDFSSATASFSIVNGVLNNPDLLIESPLIRITGAGDVNLVDETLNYSAKPVVVATLEGQGGRSLDDLDGLPIPVKCTGELQAPDCKTDFSGLLKDQAKEALEKEKQAAKEKLEKEKQQAKDKLDKEKQEAEDEARKKLEDKAKDLLNKWR